MNYECVQYNKFNVKHQEFLIYFHYKYIINVRKCILITLHYKK